MKKIILMLLVSVISLTVIGQDTASIKPASIAFKVGLFNFKKTPLTENASQMAIQGGLQYFKGITQHLDLMVNLDFANLKYPFYTSSKLGIAKNNEMYTAFDASLNYKLLTDENKLVPYLSAGLGVASINNAYYTAYAPVGLGLQIKAKQGSFINILSTYRAEASAFTKMHYNHSISYSLPLKLREKKPVMLPPAPVVADIDDDGVVGSDDDCPNASGLVKYRGCPVPDTDSDGINDENDQCPTAEGAIKYKGCPIPDADKDGINDETDKCPTAEGLSRYEGCPIPDTDKDGVNDEQDKCPSIPGIMGNNGCADLQPLANEISSQLKFESGKVNLRKKIYIGVDSLVVFMQENPNASLFISGHTDNTGTLKINQKLSLQRAMVVSNYLIKKGIDKKRISQKGFADTRPIADNKTLKGRALNRRVDIELVY
ncbi:MAG: OmpA family protein [Sediminibacterium sp.]|nr:OmpA family protein [Sediminibacterium sp.]